jgi:Gpi18-like mannosyltransferase
MAKWFNVYDIKWVYTVIVKLPAILADVAAAIMLFKLSRKQLGESMALFAAAAYAFNPAVLIDSAVWGQVDSILVLLVISAIYLIYTDKLELSAVVLAAAVMVKPQGIFFLPILLFELIRKGSLKRFFTTAAYGIITAFIIILPFAYNKEPLWIFNLFLKTASGYKGASVNAFNFFGLLGANWKADSERLFIFSYFTWGIIFIVLIMLFVFLMYLKGKNSPNPYIAAIIMVTGIFTFASRMHERYMFPAVALLLLAYIFIRDIRLLILYAAASLTSFANTWVVFSMALNDNFWIPGGSAVIKVFGILNILLFACLIWITLGITTFEFNFRQSMKDNGTNTLKKKALKARE